MDFAELKMEIEAVKAKMTIIDPLSIEFSELTVALVMLQDQYIKQAELVFGKIKRVA
jgi:hypothetical protein